MKITIDIPEIEKTCPFCGIVFDQEILERFAQEDKPANMKPRVKCNKYCSLWCAWLSDPNIYSALERNIDNRHNICEIQKIVARRVMNAITKQKKYQRVYEMQKTVAGIVIDLLKES